MFTLLLIACTGFGTMTVLVVQELRNLRVQDERLASQEKHGF